MQEHKNEAKEAPYIPVWKFKVRFPVVHYRWEWADFIQGIIMCAVCLSIIPMLQDLLGMPFEVALAIVILNGFLYLWHSWLGDPVVPGWVTPAIPLLAAWVGAFPAGPERMHALIAFQLTLAVWCFFLGSTGLARKVIHLVPRPIKSGIIIGAGIAAVQLVFKEGGRFFTMPITISVCTGVALFCMYNKWFRKNSSEGGVFKVIANLGILPAVILAIIIAPLVGEAPFNIEFGFSNPDFATLWSDWVPWGTLGWPSIDMFLKAIPLTLATYIVIFGDAVQCQAIIKEAAPARPDEVVNYDPDRSHLVVGLRNGIMSIFGPDVSMCGPMWAAMTVVTYERWKKGVQSMQSIFGGVACFRFGTFVGYWLLPVVSATKAILPAALALTMIIQGFVSVFVGVREARTLKELGIAGIVGGVLLAQGAAWALSVGAVCVVLMYGVKDFFSCASDDPILWADHTEDKK